MLARLSLSSLAGLPDNLVKPNYDRDNICAGILHIGIGNFHRAHQGVYLDNLFSQGKGHDWAIVGSGLMPSDAQRRETLKPQDWLTTVIEINEEGRKPRIIGSMAEFCHNSPTAILERLVDPAIRIVTLTITEGGYFINPQTAEFDWQHPDIQHDTINFHAPKSVFGILLRALTLRKSQGTLPFTVLSCDNLVGNGEVTHKALLGLANQIGEVDTEWVRNKVSCPNAMVDCITPASTALERSFIQQNYGYIDEAPVICEPYRQWVIEDNFPAGRPELEEVGVEFTNDVRPYEALKLNILNAGHAAIAYPAALLGIQYASDALEDKDISIWFHSLLSKEVVPHLEATPNVSPLDYIKQTYERFKNPALQDPIARLCFDGENRQPKFIFPSVYRALSHGTPLEGLALEIAFWCSYVAESQNASQKVWKAAQATRQNQAAFITQSGVFGNLAENYTFLECFAKQIDTVWTLGVRQSIHQYIEQQEVAA